jgi:hypothetical protein
VLKETFVLETKDQVANVLRIEVISCNIRLNPRQLLTMINLFQEHSEGNMNLVEASYGELQGKDAVSKLPDAEGHMPYTSIKKKSIAVSFSIGNKIS